MNIKEGIRVIEGFPTPDISFKDITTLIGDKDLFRQTVDEMTAALDFTPDVICGPEARGFIFGTAMAYKIGAGFVPIRKPGKLPYETISSSYSLEYGSDTVEMHKDAVKPGQKVLICDDLIATGGTLLACADMVERLGGVVAGIMALIELTDLPGRKLIEERGYKLYTLVKYDH
ncbi:MAG: adenine phosphoribosyltransferase [Eubacteriaceae bacterium]|nr:adenine phosphoribosyltransferase [Eubacteriaceae bacterium]